MKKKKIILLVMLIILLIVGVTVTLLYFFSDDINENLLYIKEKYDVTSLPFDDAYDDNERIYGGWNSVKIEIYRGGKLVTSLDNFDKVIQIYNTDKLQLCYIDRSDGGDNNLECVTINYSLVNNTLYVADNEVYLSGKYDVLFNDDYMILKTPMIDNKDDYALLYFLKK